MDADCIVHEGVIYYPAKDLAPLTSGVETCPGCGGEGEMYSRNCTTCKGRGVIFPPLRTTPSEAASRSHAGSRKE
jgi:hypothetical protein